jgi:hypothetical protein
MTNLSDDVPCEGNHASNRAANGDALGRCIGSACMAWPVDRPWNERHFPPLSP